MASKQEYDKLLGELNEFKQQLVQQSTSIQESHRAIYRLCEQAHDLTSRVSAMASADTTESLVQRLSAPTSDSPADTESKTPSLEVSAAVAASVETTPPVPSMEPPAASDALNDANASSAKTAPSTTSSAKNAAPSAEEQFAQKPSWDSAWAVAASRIADEERPAKSSKLSKANEPTQPFRLLPEKWETQLASVGFGFVGVLTLFVGFVFLARWVTPYITPPMRAALCYAMSLALGVVGVVTRKKLPKFAEPIMAAGMMLGFFTSFAGYFVEAMRCWSMATSAVLMSLMMILVTGVSAVRRSQPLAILAVVMGLWTAGFATSVNRAFTPAMLVGLVAMSAVLFVGFRWAKLFTLTTIGVYGEFAWWLVQDHPKNDPKETFWSLTIFLTAYFVLTLLAAVICRARVIRKRFADGEAIDARLSPLMIANRLINVGAYLLLTSAVFHATAVYWDELYVYLGVVGAVIIGEAALGWRLERKLKLDDTVMMIVGIAVVTLAVADAFEGMTLASVFALEGLCLYLVRLVTGQAVFAWLSRLFALITVGQAYPQVISNLQGMRYSGQNRLFLAHDGMALIRNLWPSIFMLTAAVLGPILKSRFDTQGTRRFELASAHLQGWLGAALLVPVLVGWIDYAPGTLATFLVLMLVALSLRVFVPMLSTLMGPAVIFAVVTEIAFLAAVDSMKKHDAAMWIGALPCLTIVVFFVMSLIAERHWLAGRRFFAVVDQNVIGLSLSACMMGALLLFAMIDTAYLIHAEATLWNGVAIAGGVGATMVLVGTVGRWTLPVLGGALWSVITTFIAIGYLIDGGNGVADGWPVVIRLWIAIVSLVLVERLFVWMCRREEQNDLARGASWLMVVLIAAASMLTTWRTFLPPDKFETIGWAAVAVLMMAGGLIGRLTSYRRTGLVVMLLSLARVYLYDLRTLPTGHKVAAFIVLGLTLVVVSFVYSRFRQQIEKWI